MKSSTTIRLIPTSRYTKNDLFHRLMTDFFYTLGYDDVQLNVPQVRRDIVYIQGQHKSKASWLRAECGVRATKKGLKNFITSLNREYVEYQREGIDAYFVLLEGNVEQVAGEEEQVEGSSLKLVIGERIIRSLEESELIASDDKVALLADKCLIANNSHGLVMQKVELLVHEIGYIKAVYFGQHKQRTHVVLIHADGSLLAESIARKIMEEDEAIGENRQALRYLTPPSPIAEYNLPTEEALTHYRKWLGEECGSIQLDGLPTDSDLGPRKLQLERLFVPLNVVFIKKADEPQEVTELANEQLPIGKLLTQAAHIAILASPGGGKSTLLKRLATAYAFPERRTEIDDNLPAHDWLPLFLRCRELQDKVRLPILSILEDIPTRVGMRAEEGLAFRQIMREALQAGRVLLLVDGLDEISQEKDRVTFANNLRSFLATFPQTALVVTSREAGFRLVAGTIASVCLYTRLATFSEEDIQNLCVRWLTEVETDTPVVRQGALTLAEDIWESERIRALAVNPLLLTTLLVVKRWIGELPRNRAALYGVAVQVLVRTWNVEGHEPLDEQETLAQLSYVACAMMEQGIQQISYNSLLKLLNEARQELEAELQFTRVSPAMFIERVESRSSLLMQTGLVLEEGELQPVYEFRHLTFQEYSAARGYAKEQHPRRNQDIPFADLLIPHFADERWMEVIPLAVVMAERKATEATIKKLVELCANIQVNGKPYPDNESYLRLLVSCILDEVKLTSNTLIAAIKAIGRRGRFNFLGEDDIEKLKSSKVGNLMVATLEQAFCSGIGEWTEYAGALGDFYEDPDSYANQNNADVFIEKIRKNLLEDNILLRIRAALQLMQFCFHTRREVPGSARAVNNPLTVRESTIQLSSRQALGLYDGINKLLSSGDWPSIMAASWALAWAGVGVLHRHPANKQATALLAKLWRQAPQVEVEGFIAWAFADNNLLDRDALDDSYIQDDGWDKFLDNRFTLGIADGRDYSARRAVVALAWYRRSPWTDEELVEKIKIAYSFGDTDSMTRTIRDQDTAFIMLKSLGKTGYLVMQQQLEFLEEFKRERSKPQSRNVIIQNGK